MQVAHDALALVTSGLLALEPCDMGVVVCQLGFTGGHALLEHVVHRGQCVACAHEAVEQQPAHQHDEWQAGVGHQLHRQVVVAEAEHQPVAQAEAGAGQTRQGEQCTGDAALVPGVVRDRNQRAECDHDQRQTQRLPGQRGLAQRGRAI